MEEKKKRRGYSTIEKQMEANRRYLQNNPEAREKRKLSTYKSNSKAFIINYATLEDLEMLRNLIETRRRELEE